MFQDILALITAFREGKKKTGLLLTLKLLTQAVELMPEDEDPIKVFGSTAPCETDDQAILDLQSIAAAQSSEDPAVAGAIPWMVLIPALLQLLQSFLKK